MPSKQITVSTNMMKNYKCFNVNKTTVIHKKRMNMDDVGIFTLSDLETGNFVVIRCTTKNKTSTALHCNLYSHVNSKFAKSKMLILERIPIRNGKINQSILSWANKLINKGHTCLSSINTWSYRLS